jgi:hypothetical protein
MTCISYRYELKNTWTQWITVSLTPETPDKKEIKKLVSAGTRAVSEELVDTYHDDRINNIVISYRSCGSDEIQSKLNLFKNLSPFLTEAKSIVLPTFGTELEINSSKI